MFDENISKYLIDYEKWELLDTFNYGERIKK